MHRNNVVAVYWVPAGYTVDPTYQSTINRYFADVAADSGKTTNVYYAATQYWDGSGSITYASNFVGSYLDTHPLPPSGCTDRYTSVCLTDQQIQGELKRLINGRVFPYSSTAIVLLTAKGIGSCLGRVCAFGYYCAYHSWMGSGTSAVLYANIPYADTVPAACGTGQRPNNSDADDSINLVSHEHNEMITDPQGSAWYDWLGQENGDKCAWQFGTVWGTAGAEYNQTIDGNHYYLQKEWSNASTTCVQQGT